MINSSVLQFVPGFEPKKLTKCAAFDVGALILDLEDAVSYAEKDSARDLVSQALDNLDFGDKYILIRINDFSSKFWKDDVVAMSKCKRANALMVPKASPEAIKATAELLDECGNTTLELAALIETAMAVEEVPEIIKASKRMKCMLFGAGDYSVDCNVERTREGLDILYARMRIVNAASAYKIDAYDTPFTDLKNPEYLEEDCQKARDIGFRGKASIYPNHIETMKRIFMPPQEEIDYCLRLVEAVDYSIRVNAVQFEGKMIDGPIIVRAFQTLAKAGIKVKPKGDSYGEYI